MKSSQIAIVGLAGRFPGARNLSGFWRNLSHGVESVRRLSAAELLAAGVDPQEMAHPDYVKAAATLDDVDLFDASFFGFSPRDASIMDPQHRHFLECAWEALEDAGHPPQAFEGAIAVFAGSGINSYLIYNLLANRRLRESAGLFQLKQTGNDKDVLSTRVSYQLNLRGPSINVQTACSTSLVAVHLACQSLLDQECDMALAGGVTIEIPHGRGYQFREGEILSRDGHCRAFDAASSGTVFGSGTGIVVLRRMEDAVADRDNIRAIILGSAINNDGARKAGYLAPSVEGQAEVVAEALSVAGVTADDISYVETHGTGTTVGDPIEIRALTQAFRNSSARNGYCAIGSLKTNVGHLDAAAGIAGLIKTVLSLEHRQLPASLHFDTPNPLIDFRNSPFFVNSRLAEWDTDSSPRRAGVTALGIGGTNAHVVLEEAPARREQRSLRPYQLLTLSAKTEFALERACVNLGSHLQAHPELNLADVAFTCQVGRQGFPYRRALVVRDLDQACQALAAKAGQSAPCPAKPPQVAFLFSGQGSQYANMGRELYETEAVFREALDCCAAKLEPHLGFDLRQALYPAGSEIEAATEKLNQTWLTQPVLFAIEYSLARWWMSLGIEPHAMVGHSIGEYTAACLAGVFSLDDALEVTAFRGRLIYGLPSGSMLAVPLPPGEIQVNGTLAIAAINNPRECVVSGPTPAVAELEASLAKQSVSCHRLRTSHAFHSAMMDPILERFVERMKRFRLRPPRIPYLSNVTGTWIKAGEATDPVYWARHLRETVRFSGCLDALLGEPAQLLLEVGPGQSLASMARQRSPQSARVYQSLRHPRETVSDTRFALRTLGDIWVAGGHVEWSALHSLDSVTRVSLPTYPFEHQRFWIDADAPPSAAMPSMLPAHSPTERTDSWFYRRVWRKAPLTQAPLDKDGCWILFEDSGGLAGQIAAELKTKNQKVLRVAAGNSYRRGSNGEYMVRPGVRGDYDALIDNILKSGCSPPKIVHLWSVQPAGYATTLEETLDRSFYGPLFLAQSLAEQDISGVDIALVSNCLQSVSGESVVHPARAVLLGPARVTPKELPGIRCRAIDVELDNGTGPRECAAQIVAEMAAASVEPVIAYRHGDRFTETVEPVDIRALPRKTRAPLQTRGVYLLTGGLGGIGLVIAEYLAREFKARLVLVSRSTLPPENLWEDYLENSSEPAATKEKIRKLLEIRSLATSLLVAQADVTQPDQMREVVDRARRQFGGIDGAFHAAGALEDAPLILKTRESAARVLEAKVRGTMVLEEVLRDCNLQCFVLFSSVSSLLAPAGQVDYAAANAFLDTYALSRGGTVTAIDWGLWRDVGMGLAVRHPLLQQRLVDTREERVYSSALSQRRHWLLGDHRLKGGKALVPGSGYIEMAAAALEAGSVPRGIEFEDVFFLAPLMFDRPESKEVRVHLKREGSAFQFSIQSREGGWIEHSTGRIARLVGTRPKPMDRAAITARCREQEFIFDGNHRTKQEQYLDFGPRWRCLKRLLLGKGECLAELSLDAPFAEECSSWRMHPALLDMATGCALYALDKYVESEDLYLPVSYRSLRNYAPIPPKLYSYIRPQSGSSTASELAVFDVTLFDEQGEVLAEAEGFSMRRIADPSALSAGKQPAPTAARTVPSHLADAGERAGIPSQDGVRALVRILMTETPSLVVVSPQDLRQPEVAPATAPLKTNRSAAHGDEVEDTIVAWWKELLGTEQIGPDDDFFDLGGHSLVALRLFSKIRKSYHVDLGLATLFEARTVRQLAALIRASNSPARTLANDWSPLVPIQPNGARPPLFLVHGIGGTVLFYNDLATCLGPDQPVYGLQSPFVSVEHKSQETLEELASIYIDAMRGVSPLGPYALGGASLGGLIAFEMARQLYTVGKKPDLLLLFDTAIPRSDQRLTTAAQASRHWQNFRRDGASYLLRKLKAKVTFVFMRPIYALVPIVKALACRCYRLIGLALPTPLRVFQTEQLHGKVLEGYTPQVYPGKVTLIRATDFAVTVGTLRNPTLGWDKFAGGGLATYDVPGAHTSMFREPNVKILAATLKTILPM